METLWDFLAEIDINLVLAVVNSFIAVILGWIAIKVSVAANEIARDRKDLMEKQTELHGKRVTLVERQTKLAEAGLKPRFRIELERHEREEPFDEVRLYNDGHPVDDFSVRDWSFLEIERINSNLTKREVKHIPVSYFHDWRYTNQTSGLLLVFTSIRSPEVFGMTGNMTRELERLCREIEQELDGSIRYTVLIRHFLRIAHSSYIETENVLYQINPPYRAWYGPPIPQVVSEDCKNQIVSAGADWRIVDIESITARNIEGDWEKLGRLPEDLY